MFTRRPYPYPPHDPRSLTRRDLIRTFGAGALAALSIPAGVRQALAQAVFIDFPFQLGVAAGDPAPDGFVIWTRLAPRPLEPGYGMPTAPVEVEWQVAEDPGFRQIARSGTVVARPELGHACHVEVSGLKPGRQYHYRFAAGRERSMSGRARTAPEPGSSPARLRFAQTSCQRYQDGYFTALRHLSEESDVDFILFVGDYIYEDQPKPFVVDRVLQREVPWVRPVSQPSCFTLDDYRRRYALYKLDPDLQWAHASAAYVPTWDDGEVNNNWADAVDQSGTPPEVFLLRRVAAAQAYYENMPLRRSSWPLGPAIRLHRRLDYGNLLAAHVLDTRQHRTDQPCGDWLKPACPQVDDPKATLLGADQERWLFDGLQGSGARWNLIAQQVVMMPFDFALGQDATINMDAWDGYRVGRRRLLKHLHDRKVRNPVVLSGDMHQNIAGTLHLQPDDAASPSVATEIVGTSVSAEYDGADVRSTYPATLARCPHIKFLNSQRGYALHTLDKDRWSVDFRVMDRVRTPGGTISTRMTMVIEDGVAGPRPA